MQGKMPVKHCHEWGKKEKGGEMVEENPLVRPPPPFEPGFLFGSPSLGEKRRLEIGGRRNDILRTGISGRDRPQ